MLRQCSTSLLHFAHREGVRHGALGGVYDHITLQSLQWLELHGTSIVFHLTLPSLRRLTVTGEFRTSEERFSIQHLLSRSSAVLQHLSITFHEKGKPALTEIQLLLQTVPTITDLELTLPAHVDLTKIVRRFSPADTLPLMANLVVDAVRVSDYITLLRVLCARRTGGPVALNSFMLSLRPAVLVPIPEVAMAQFHDLAVGGLKIHIQLGSSVLLDTC
jgi:hypothetical protein